MKNLFILAMLALVLESCDKSPCHQEIYIKNASDTPIKIMQVCGFNPEPVKYALINVGALTYPGETTTVEIAYRRNCIEELIEWTLSHPSLGLQPIYICDTALPEQLFYSTVDSVLLNYPILGRISLLDIGIDSLKRCDFTLQFP